MNYKLIKNSMSDDTTRIGYNRLATESFGLSFENWYNSGYFDGSHVPYTLFDDEKAVANISVNHMKILYRGKVRKYIQLGTVMTRPEYRGQGLQRLIFENILDDLSDKSDAIFLFANKSVLDFYPKLGFERAEYFSFSKSISRKETDIKKLDMSNARDVALLKKHYEKGNPFSALQVVDNFSLLMFYCGSFFKDFVYYLPEYDAAVIAEIDGDSLTCYGIYCDADKDINNILASFGDKKISLGFTPKDKASWICQPVHDDNTALFIYKDSENIFKGNKLLFELINHT